VLKRERIYPYDVGAMTVFGEQCSMTERRADDATREVDAWLKCEFLKDRIGEEFAGVIAAVTNFGVFVELSDLYIEGLLHVSALPGDYYHFDQAKQRLVGERTRRSFQLGGAVTVRVARVDLDDRKIDLELAGLGEPRRSLKPKRASRRDPAEGTARKSRGKHKNRDKKEKDEGKTARKKPRDASVKPEAGTKNSVSAKSSRKKKRAPGSKRQPGSGKQR